MKKILTLFTSALLVIAFVCSVAAIELPFDPFEPDDVDPNIKSGVCGKTFSLTWTFNTQTGVLTISGNDSMKDRNSTQKAPWQSYIASIKTIVVYPGVTHIGDYAFYSCSAATSIVFCGTEMQWSEITKGTNWLPASVSNVELHKFVNGVCTVCGVECTHDSLVDGICSTCGMKIKTTVLGDVNGDEVITNSDVLAIYRYIYNSTLYPLDETVADVNKDGNVTNSDVLAIYRYIYNPTLYPLG